MAEPFVDDEAMLYDYQLALVEHLCHAGLTPAERVQRLREDPRAAPYARYVATIDARFMEVAAELMRIWGRRR